MRFTLRISRGVAVSVPVWLVFIALPIIIPFALAYVLLWLTARLLVKIFGGRHK